MQPEQVHAVLTNLLQTTPEPTAVAVVAGSGIPPVWIVAAYSILFIMILGAFAMLIPWEKLGIGGGDE